MAERFFIYIMADRAESASSYDAAVYWAGVDGGVVVEATKREHSYVFGNSALPPRSPHLALQASLLSQSEAA